MWKTWKKNVLEWVKWDGKSTLGSLNCFPPYLFYIQGRNPPPIFKSHCFSLFNVHRSKIYFLFQKFSHSARSVVLSWFGFIWICLFFKKNIFATLWVLDIQGLSPGSGPEWPQSCHLSGLSSTICKGGKGHTPLPARIVSLLCAYSK